MRQIIMFITSNFSYSPLITNIFENSLTLLEIFLGILYLAFFEFYLASLS